MGEPCYFKLGGVKRHILSNDEINEIKSFYNPFFNVNPLFHEFYFNANGLFDVKYIPDDIYYTIIDPYYNNWNEARVIDNKTYYEMMFNDVKQPILIAKRCAGVWTDKNGQMIQESDIAGIIASYNCDCFIKKAVESEGAQV